MQSLPTILPYIQVILAVLLIVGVVLQQSSASLGGAFGGGDNWSASFHTRRGFEKTLFNGSIIISSLFIATSIVALVIQ